MGYITDFLNEQNDNLGKLKEELPEQMEGFFKFMNATEKDGALNGKTKELIALSLAVKAQCHWCVAIHVKNSIAKGATKEEMLEASMMAVLMGGGPALMYIKHVQDAIDELQG